MKSLNLCEDELLLPYFYVSPQSDTNNLSIPGHKGCSTSLLTRSYLGDIVIRLKYDLVLTGNFHQKAPKLVKKISLKGPKLTK